MAASAHKEQLENMMVQNAETRRLMEEREMLMKKKEALTRNLNSANETLAIGESTVTALEELLTTKNVKIEETLRLEEENETLKKNIAELSGDLSSAKKTVTKGKSTVTALKQRLRNERVKVEETDRLRVQKETLEKIKLAREKELRELLNFYEAVIMKKSGTHCEGVTIKQEPAD